MENFRFVFTTIYFTYCVSILASGQHRNCPKGQDAAKKLISNNRIFFPRVEGGAISPTLTMLLEVDYKIEDELYDNGFDFDFEGENECFYQVMLQEIETKWGKDFMKLKKAEADKLDKNGIGYVEPKENGIRDSLRRYVRENAPKRDIKKGYLIELKISPDRKLESYKVFFGLIRPQPIEKKSDDYLFVGKALDHVTVNCEPGRFRDKPIESSIYFYLDF